MHSTYEHPILGTITVIIRPMNRSLRIRVKEDAYELVLPGRLWLSRGKELVNSNVEKLQKMRAKALARPKVEDPTKAEKAMLKQKALAYLPQRLQELAQQYGFQFRNVGVRAMKTRWGSCSSFGDIHLSIYLVNLPQELSDYVMVHELCHTRQMNHSPKFWAEVERIYPNYLALKQQMKWYHYTGELKQKSSTSNV